MLKRPDADAQIEAMLAQERYEDAARALDERGRFSDAQAVYEGIWDYAAAARMAMARSERVEALRCLIAAKDFAGVASVAAEIRERGDQAEARRAIAIYERGAMTSEAAELYERIGDLEGAIRAYERAHLPLEIARIEEARGGARRAGLIYERYLSEQRDEATVAHVRVALARILASFNRLDEAARQLQRALAQSLDEASRTDALTQLAACLAALDYEESARFIARSLGNQSLDDLLDRANATSAATQPRQPIVAGRYRVEGLLGSGAVGRVYRARDLMTERSVALKLVTPPIDDRSRAAYQRFTREARLCSELRHARVVQVHDVEETFGLIAMELMEGGTLRDELAARGPLPLDRLRMVLTQVTEALSAAHARGLVHRDVKPANLFVAADGSIKLGDFGAAHLQSSGVTRTAGFVGTLAYMSPEQISGAPLSAATDVYSLGATLYELATGRTPFVGADLVGQHLAQKPARARTLRPTLDEEWDELLADMLAKDPSARPSPGDLLSRTRTLRSEERGRATVTREARATTADAHSMLDERYIVGAEIRRAAHSIVYHAQDRELGRSVWIERFSPDYLASDEGARHLTWLRGIAKLQLFAPQRILDLEVHSDGSVDVFFDALSGSSVSDAALEGAERRRVRAALDHFDRAAIERPDGVLAMVSDGKTTRIRIAGTRPRSAR